MNARLSIGLLVCLCICGALVLPVQSHAKELTLPVCYGFSCKIRQIVSITPAEWRSVVNWLDGAATTPEGERQQIRQAIGWMEVVVSRYTPTHLDKGMNLENHPVDMTGQMDCIDESINTTTYLTLFEQQGRLHWHRVTDRAYRGALFDAHWAAQIEQVDSGVNYVVDSWFQDNGMLPYIAKSAEWVDLRWTFFRNQTNN